MGTIHTYYNLDWQNNTSEKWNEQKKNQNILVIIIQKNGGESICSAGGLTGAASPTPGLMDFYLCYVNLQTESVKQEGFWFLCKCVKYYFNFWF